MPRPLSHGCGAGSAVAGEGQGRAQCKYEREREAALAANMLGRESIDERSLEICDLRSSEPGA